MTALSKNFHLQEFACKCGCETEFVVDSKLVLILQAIRDEVGPLRITSGHRCPGHNKASGGSKRSFHLLRKNKLYAADIQPLDPTRKTLEHCKTIYILADKLDAGGVGLYPTWCHVDTRSVNIFAGNERARWIAATVELT